MGEFTPPDQRLGVGAQVQVKGDLLEVSHAKASTQPELQRPIMQAKALYGELDAQAAAASTVRARVAAAGKQLEDAIVELVGVGAEQELEEDEFMEVVAAVSSLAGPGPGQDPLRGVRQKVNRECHGGGGGHGHRRRRNPAGCAHSQMGRRGVRF